MTILLGDAKEELARRGVKLHEDCLVNDLVYADDTLLIDVDEKVLEQFMECVGAAGQQYGLAFNWSKLEAMPVRKQATIEKPYKSQLQQNMGWFTWAACCLQTEESPQKLEDVSDKGKRISIR